MKKEISLLIVFAVTWITCTAQAQNVSNAMYCKTLPEKPFHWQCIGRIPLLLTETVGLGRKNYPVRIALEFPGKTDPNTIRIATPYGKVVPCQASKRVSDNKIDLSFNIDIPADFQVPLFVYYGAKTSNAAVPDYPVRLRQTDDAFILSNNLFEIAISKNAVYNGGLLRSMKTHDQSASQLSCQYNHFCWGSFRGLVKPGTKAKLKNNGPICKSVLFNDGEKQVEFAVFSNAPEVYYTISGKGRFAYSVDFTPGGDLREDCLYYRSIKGPKRLFLYWQMPDDCKNYKLRPYLAEGWLAFYDHRMDALSGIFFDLENSRAANLDISGTGYIASISGRMPDNGKVSGGLYCAGGRFQKLRQAYCSWKAPVQIFVGKPQEFSQIKTKVPVFGKDFLRIQFVEVGRTRKMSSNSARKLVDVVLSSGANSMDFACHAPCFNSKEFPVFDDTPEFLKEVVKTAHNKGVSVIVGAWPSKYYVRRVPKLMDACYWLSEDGKKLHKGRLSPFLAHDIYVKFAAGLAQCDVDGYRILDEFGFWPSAYISRKGREYAKKRYGAECAPLQDWAKIKKSEQLTAFKFRVDTVTDLVRDMSAAVRKLKPNAMVFQVTSMNNHRLGASGYQDMEAQSQYLSTASFDLYTNNIEQILFPVKYARAARGNKRPVISTIGMCKERFFNRLNTQLHLFSGANSLLHFALTGYWTSRGGALGQLGTTEVYNTLAYTGLEKYLVRCFPLKFAAVFRDRDNFYGELKRGEIRAGKLSGVDAKVKSLINALRTIPTDIVLAKYFSSEELKDYKILIVPDNLDISPANAETIKQYVEAGGIALIEGGTTNNIELRKLCGVKSTGIPKNGKFTFQTKSATLTVSGQMLRYPLKCNGAKMLASFSDGTPAVAVNYFGKGKAICIAPVLSGKADSDTAIANLFFELIRNNVENLPLTTKSEIWSNIFTDGKDFLISLYNPENKMKSIEITLGNFVQENKTELLEFNSGRKIHLNNRTARLSLAPGAVNFYFLTDSTYKLPELKKIDGACLAKSFRPEFSPYCKLKLKRAGSRKLKKRPGVIYVGIFRPAEKKNAGNFGAEAIYARATKLDQVEAYYLPDLKGETIADFDVLVVPNIGFKPISNLNKGWESELHNFVSKGGGALLIHHSVGYGSDSKASKLFPKVAVGKDWVPITGMIIENKNHPVINASAYINRFPKKSQDPAFAHIFKDVTMSKGEHLRSGFPDYIKLQPGTDGTILVRSEFNQGRGGDATVVVGKCGKGRVVISGMNIGAEVRKENGKSIVREKLSKIESNILTNSIYWLGEKK